MKLLVTKDNIKTFGILTAVGAVSILLGFITDRSICIFYNITGVPCPSCGMTRAFLHLFHGDIRGAFWYHPLFLLVFFIPFVIKSDKKIYLHGAIFIFIAVWIIRLVLLYPHTSPMVYMKGNYLEYVRTIIINLFSK